LPGVAPNCLAVSGDGKYLAFVTREFNLEVADILTGKELAFQKVEHIKFNGKDVKPSCYSILFLPDGKGILSAHTDGMVRLWGVPGN
jgi:WD40 repeat protein